MSDLPDFVIAKNIADVDVEAPYTIGMKGVNDMGDSSDGSGIQTTGDVNPTLGTPAPTPAPAPEQGDVPSPETPKED